MSDSQYDIVVIGAGMAGLAAARELQNAGRRVIILEARDRIGGRVATLRNPAIGMFELGAEFVHGLPDDTWAILRSSKMPVYEVAGATWWSDNGRISLADGLWEHAGPIFEAMMQPGLPDQSFADFLRHHPVDSHTSRRVIGYVEGFNAADAARIGIHGLARQEFAQHEISGDRSFRVAGGYDQVAQAIAGGFDPERVTIRLNTAVTEIAWRTGEVHVQIASVPEPVHATAALITVPLGVLQAPPGSTGAIQFVPEPDGYRAALAELVMGMAIKVGLRFRTPFWEHESLSISQEIARDQMSFLLSNDPVVPTWWSMYPASVPLLVGWVAGPAARSLANQPDTVIVEQALAALARVTGVEVARLTELLEGQAVHNWQADPYARGAYSYLPAGSMAAQERLAQPIEGTLVLAGEALAIDGHIGTVHGAIASGRWAARGLLEARNVS